MDAALADTKSLASRQTVLIVDDAATNRMVLVDMLSDEYNTLEAANGVEAKRLLSEHRSSISLILLDIVMPEMDGFAFLEYLNEQRLIEDIPVIMISAETSSSAIVRAYGLGAVDFINRPFDFAVVQRRVQNTLLLYAKQKRLQQLVSDQIEEKERNNLLMIEILSSVVEFRNNESGCHVLRIRLITELLLETWLASHPQSALTPSTIALISNASALHDIGKIAIPEEILNKPGKLTPEEFEVIKTHAAHGADALSKLHHRQGEPIVQIAHDICRWHHERWDGRGYPDGLAGDAIPFPAHVVALADVYDALTSERVYKPAYTHDEAVDMILRGECGAFNPELLACFVSLRDTMVERIEERGGLSGSLVEPMAIVQELESKQS